MTERWERRERKIQKRKARMRVTGRGLLTVIAPLEAKRERDRKAKAA